MTGPPQERTAFVGDDRRQLVEHLRSSFTAVKENGGVQVVVLEALPGWGKTRIVQELYARLAAERSPPVYWPAALFDASQVEPERGRKSIYPTQSVSR